MKPFMKIDNVGELRMDVVIFESYYPILFTCLNEREELFLCVCCQANKNGKKWLITKTTQDIVISMLENSLTMREAFLKFPQVQISVLDNAKEIMISEHNQKDWDYDTSIELPDKGEYLDAEEGEFDEEISYYRSMTIKKYNTSFKEVKFTYSSEQLEEISDNLFDRIETTDVCYRMGSLNLKNTEIYKQIKKEMQQIYVDQNCESTVDYNQMYENFKTRIMKGCIISKVQGAVENCVEGISEAA